jgi:pyruvate/2-oxoglutarate dehydrogenase complex dihydrolipoamide dehydrogenase (E3) component
VGGGHILHYCVGREARTHGLGLDLAKVELDAHSGKIIVDSSDTTTTSSIFAIGDAINVSHRFTYFLVFV